MKNNGISYKNLYKYDFINLYEAVHGPLKPKYISFKNRNINTLTIDNIKNTQTPKKFNRNSKYFRSFHKSLLHLKLSINPKFKNNENICLTERSAKNKKEIENFKNIYEKIFLTNTDDKRKNNIKYPEIITDYNTKFDQNLLNNDYISIPSNTFLSFRKNKYLFFLPDIINEKISDFVDDCQTLRKVKFINHLKIERKKRKKFLTEIKLDENEIEINLLKKNLQLINIYKRCFGEYNKFLINEIKKEKKILNDNNKLKRDLEDQVNILQKKFDDIIKEFEVVNNFKLIFTAIKNKRKLGNISKQSKKYIEGLKFKLKKEVKIPKNILNIRATKIKKTQIRKSKAISKLSFGFLSKLNLNENEKNMQKMKQFKKSISTLILQQPQMKSKKKNLERCNTYRPPSSQNKKRFEKIINKKDIIDYDIDRNENVLIKNILKLVNKYNDINFKIMDFKLMTEREDDSEKNIKNNKIMVDQKNKLIYIKNYNKTLKTKYQILHNSNKDYSLHLAIYKKINQIISTIITFKVKNFNHIIDKIRKSYDKNKLYYTYKIAVKDPKSRETSFEKELINYIYNALVLIELLQCELINKKNEYLNINYFKEQIIEYENKMDAAKKMINSREKRNIDILRKQQMYEKITEKSNRIIFRPFRNASLHYPPKHKNYLTKNVQNNDDEDFILY